MKVEEFLTAADVAIDVKTAGKNHLLQDLAERAAPRAGLDVAQIAQELSKREALGSTGVGHGVAIPHARFTSLERPFGMFIRLKRPIEFEAIDGEPVDLIFLLLQPAAPSDLNALAAVARALREPDTLTRLREANDAGELYRELTK